MDWEETEHGCSVLYHKRAHSVPPVVIDTFDYYFDFSIMLGYVPVPRLRWAQYKSISLFETTALSFRVIWAIVLLELSTNKASLCCPQVWVTVLCVCLSVLSFSVCVLVTKINGRNPIRAPLSRIKIQSFCIYRS